MRNNAFLIYLFFFFSGFARLNQTKFYGVQVFVLLALVIVGLYSYRPRLSIKKDPSFIDYKKFILWSIIPLFIGLYFKKYDAIYFFVYTVVPLFLCLKVVPVNFNYWLSLLFAQVSLLIAVILGWMVFGGIIPITALYSDVTEAEMGIGYWGISYLSSSRNHDYMYPMVCAAIAIWQYKNSNNTIEKLVQFAIFLFCEVTLLASLSRGAMIVTALYMFFLYRGQTRNEKRFFIFAMLLLFVVFWGTIINMFNTVFEDIFYSIFGLRTETATGSRFSNEDRKYIYWNAIIHILKNPVGYGIQNYSIMNDYGGGSAENAYLTVFVERGWMAGAYFILFLWSKLKLIFKKTINNKNLNYYLVPALVVYFLFNYEFTSYMCCFVFFIVLINDQKSSNITCS